MDLSQRQRCTSLPREQQKGGDKSPTLSPLATSSNRMHQPLKFSRSHTLQNSDAAPDLGTMKLPSKVIDRIKRDFNVSATEISALRGIISKVDLYDNDVRERWQEILKSESTMDVNNIDPIAHRVIKDSEIDGLKQKLFLSRKELDTYISFTKKMEREKRQSVSEKEELETKLQWHERRLKRFEEENKSLKSEKNSLCKQVNELRGKSGKESPDKKVDQTGSVNMPEIDMSKQRLIYEADTFAQERSKLIKDRQRLEEEVRTVQIRCVNLLAQLKRSEGVVSDLKGEKETLKTKLDDAMCNSSRSASISHAESQIKKCQDELKQTEQRYENLQNELRNMEESKIELHHENMALKDTVNVVQKANEDANQRVKEIDLRYRETLGELRILMLSSEKVEQQLKDTRQELDLSSDNIADLQQDIESDQELFNKFLEWLSIDLKRNCEEPSEKPIFKLDGTHTLQEQIEIVKKHVEQYDTQTRKLQEKYDDLLSERDDLEQESKDLKYVLQQRMDVTKLKLSMPTQNCECSKEKAKLKDNLEDCRNQIDSLEDEVNRLHQDKQQLLMSFLNLQASNSQRQVDVQHPQDHKDDGCKNTGQEIRHYLSIIEELTEEKLRLENLLNDMEIEKEKLCDEIERLS